MRDDDKKDYLPDQLDVFPTKSLSSCSLKDIGILELMPLMISNLRLSSGMGI